MKHNSGFSLTELSIVIVVIGLISTAIFQGKSLIESAKARSIVSEFSTYTVALNSFRSYYSQYPGDFNEAVVYWGGTTVNGDKSGKIEFINAGSTYEGFRAWQHLSYAQMIEIALVGTQTTTAAGLGTDVPASKTGGGYFLEYGAFGLTDFNTLILGIPAASTVTTLVKGVMTPNQALNIDSKIDDGAPGAGSVRAKDGNGATAENCVNDVTDNGVTSDDNYKITINGKDCTIATKLSD